MCVRNQEAALQSYWNGRRHEFSSGLELGIAAASGCVMGAFNANQTMPWG